MQVDGAFSLFAFEAFFIFPRNKLLQSLLANRKNKVVGITGKHSKYPAGCFFFNLSALTKEPIHYSPLQTPDTWVPNLPYLKRHPIRAQEKRAPGGS